jgi:alpha-glucosidase
VLLLTLRGTPFLYQGEELGLVDAEIPVERQVDPGGRDGCRAPLPWDGSDAHGWPVTGGGGPWLPFPPDPRGRNHRRQRNDGTSILHLYRRLIALRHRAPGLALGDFELLDLPDSLLGYQRGRAEETWVVVVNFSDQAVPLGDRGAELVGLAIEVSSDGIGEGHPFDGRMGADQAVVLGR